MNRRSLLALTFSILSARLAGATPSRFRNASEYNRAHAGLALLVMEKGKVVYQDGAGKAHELASGTKSFWGVGAAMAAADGRYKLDERVCDTITEWKKDPRKAAIRVFHLLDLTSGLDPGSSTRLADYQEAIAADLLAPPGQNFLYGPTSFQCFGEFLRRKGIDPLAFLEKRLFRPIGLGYANWKRTPDGNPGMAWGASLTARNWALFGEFVRQQGPRLARCFQGTHANPCYGLTWWLNRPVQPGLRNSIPELARGQDLWGIPGIPADLVFAAGVGKQRLFISRQEKFVIVRQAEKHVEGYSDLEFLKTILGL